MNFFVQQDKARKKTFILVVYFILAIVLIVAAVNTVVFFIFYYAADQQQTPEQWLAQPYWIWIALATVAVIGLGSLKDIIRLGGGGKAVAEMVGARPVNSSTRDPAEIRLINIVEEMSIASGTPRPALYVMDEEQAINAF
ncbi:MAG: peptidase, partial [Gammaproteobacteria bacterium]|nr:peptidase [Gammaproteobacteria bacterium]